MAAKQKFNSISSSAVKAKTGKGWSDWFKMLDKEKAHRLPHKEIALLLNKKYQVSPWWSQMVAVGYEQAKGLRVANQRTDGNFNVDISKVMNVGLGDLYEWVADDAKRKKWLKEEIEIRKAVKDKIIRANFKGLAANLSFAFYVKGEQKAQVVVTQTKLSSAEEVEETRGFWKAALEKLNKLNGVKDE